MPLIYIFMKPLKSPGKGHYSFTKENIEAFEQQCKDNLLPKNMERYHFQQFGIEQRPGMLGKTPHYKLAIDSTGLVKYEGFRNTKKIGKHQWQLTPNRLQELRFILAKYNFFGFNPRFYKLTPVGNFIMTLTDKHGETKEITAHIREDYLKKVRTNLEEEVYNCLLLDEWLLGDVYIFIMEERTNGDYARHIVGASNPADAVQLLNEKVYKDLNIQRNVDDFDFRKTGIANDDAWNGDSSQRFFDLLHNKTLMPPNNNLPTQATPEVFYSSVNNNHYGNI